MRRSCDDWPVLAAETAAVLRVDSSLHPDDRALHELVGELAVRSAEFRALWNEHRVHECQNDRVRFRHPVAGTLDLDYESLEVAGAARQHLVAYTAPVGSPSEESLRLLASWSASSPSSERAPTERDSTTDAP